MDNRTLLADLRAALSGPPSADAWTRCVHLTERAAVADLLPVALDYLRDHIRRGGWPDALRAITLNTPQQLDDPPPSWPLIRTLRLRLSDRSDDTDDDRWRALQSPALAHITTLDLRNTFLPMRGIRLLARAAALPQLRHLDLGHNYFWADAVHALTAGPLAAQLRTLDLTGNHAHSQSLQRLARAPNLANLTSLSLVQNQITSSPDHLRAIATSPHLARLRHFDISLNAIYEHGATALAPLAARLRRLHLYYNLIDDHGLRALLQAPTQLAVFDLRANRLTPTSAELLSITPNLSRLASLDLSRNPIGPDGARLLARAAHLGHLTRLHLNRCDITTDAALDLLTHLPRATPRLRLLDLSQNPLDPDAVQRFHHDRRLERVRLIV